MAIPDAVKRFGLNKVFGYLERDPRKNAPKIMEFVDKHTPANLVVTQRNFMRNVLNDPENIWYKLIMSVFDEVDPHIVRQAFQNFVVNGIVCGWPQQQKERKDSSCNIPWCIAIDPTSASNSRPGSQLTGQYAPDLNLSFDEMDDIVEQGKALGIYIYEFTGGEPLLRWRELIALANKHNDCEFICFTNGLLVDEEFCAAVKRVGNLVPLVCLEGFGSTASLSQPDGPLAGAMRAMDLMHELGLVFGTACSYEAANVETAGSDDFYDWNIAHHAKFCCFFSYMPTGTDSDAKRIVGAQQREWMYSRIRALRKTKQLLVMDFSGDGEYVGGCVAGGRRYLHITANGDVDPCIFVPFSDSNIREKTLMECLQSPFFQAYRTMQPFNDNMLMPCPLMDNPHCLSDMVKSSGAHCTDVGESDDVEAICARCANAAREWAPHAERLWGAKCHNPALLSK